MVKMPGFCDSSWRLGQWIIFRAINLIQTRESEIPVVLFNSHYWGGLVSWLKGTMLKHGYIHKNELDIFTLVDKPKDVALAIKKFYEA